MAKISPVSIKYMIHASLIAEGALEKPDVIGALFGQTEGLLGADLEMRDLQKEGKIGRIEVELERKDRKTFGKIKIPTALDQSETTLIAAAVETIERVGPSDAQIEVENIEDVRGSKRDYILERAKKLISANPTEPNALFERLKKIGIKVESIADVLGLDKTDYLNRRLQTVVVKKKLVTTVKGARQLITHKKVLVDGKVVDSDIIVRREQP